MAAVMDLATVMNRPEMVEMKFVVEDVLEVGVAGHSSMFAAWL
jgi:hypothetical protein